MNAAGLGWGRGLEESRGDALRRVVDPLLLLLGPLPKRGVGGCGASLQNQIHWGIPKIFDNGIAVDPKLHSMRLPRGSKTGVRWPAVVPLRL